MVKSNHPKLGTTCTRGSAVCILIYLSIYLLSVGSQRFSYIVIEVGFCGLNSSLPSLGALEHFCPLHPLLGQRKIKQTQAKII